MSRFSAAVIQSQAAGNSASCPSNLEKYGAAIRKIGTYSLLVLELFRILINLTTQQKTKGGSA